MNEKAQDTAHRKYFEQESWRLRTQKKRIEMLELRRCHLDDIESWNTQVELIKSKRGII